MTIALATNPDLSRLLIAGRKAALAALYDQERNKTVPGSINQPPEAYDGKGELLLMTTSVANVDIGPAIDAAVLEVAVQIAHPDGPSAQRRPWWRFW